MMMTMRAGLNDGGGRDGDMRIHIGDSHRGAGFQPGPARGFGGQLAGLLCRCSRYPWSFSLRRRFPARVEGFEERLGWEAFALGPDRFVTGGGVVARLNPGELPDHPVGGFNEAVGGSVDIRGFIQDLPDLGEEPFRADLAAVAVEEIEAFSRRAISLSLLASGWAAWCFHSLTQE